MNDARQEAIREHIKWCRAERDVCAGQLQAMEGGTFKMGHIGDQGMIDDTPAWIEKHRTTIAQMDRIIQASGDSDA